MSVGSISPKRLTFMYEIITFSGEVALPKTPQFPSLLGLGMVTALLDSSTMSPVLTYGSGPAVRSRHRLSPSSASSRWVGQMVGVPFLLGRSSAPCRNSRPCWPS